MPDIEIVIPVFNEERVLERSVRRVLDHCERLPYDVLVTVADNASTDGTQAIARRLTGIRYLRLEAKGRGRALRAAWSTSQARVVAYMDVDLSTDLNALLPLVAPLLSGHSDIAIGTRLTRSARVQRGLKREVISRGYNAILKTTLRARFSDAQCGFKAMTCAAATRLLDTVRDDEWFFDTELLIRAQRAGMRVHEVPVDWVDDPDSRVKIVSTAAKDLRGVARLIADVPLVRFAAVGAVSTLAYALLFLALHSLGPGAANVLALAITAVGNTAANRRFTFRVRDNALAHHVGGFLVFAFTTVLTLGALAGLEAVDPTPARAVELAVLIGASVVATVMRYLALKALIHHERRPLLRNHA